MAISLDSLIVLKYRAAAGLTQEQLGFTIGVTRSSVSAWENKRETPSFRTLGTSAKH
ncbi:helix-turn-helix transcriptional regulator [Stenotrophomonas sp. HMWF023]|uniref:helix-turn-helix transcriptional regulator n=1 Tax=Stenotrophomonas sp. HMWF023 TaxID=2056859 RepID=UPI0015E83B03|nr:helix-turn-helix transcriptional regulator [Stenotrophomonas sp. HMWF023]